MDPKEWEFWIRYWVDQVLAKMHRFFGKLKILAFERYDFGRWFLSFQLSNSVGV